MSPSNNTFLNVRYSPYHKTDISLATKIAEYLITNGEEVCNSGDALYREDTSRNWLFWRYHDEDKVWTRSKYDEILRNRPKSELVLRKLKLNKLEIIGKNAKK